jgi:ergothioneine biosynthesis protein EgtB
MSETSLTGAPVWRSPGKEGVPLRRRLPHDYPRVRQATVALAQPLSPEDCQAQSMPDVSPTKWHLAHTSWFFETFVLARARVDYQPVDPAYATLFNSYYNAVGEQHARPERGALTRPSLEQVLDYRRIIDEQVVALLQAERCSQQLLAVIELGLHHEQQHQELILSDIKHVFSRSALHPAYADATPATAAAIEMRFAGFEAGVIEIGHGADDFCFDNEQPRHRVFLERFELASRLVTAGDFLAFMEDDGYTRAELWLSEGWAWLQQHGIAAPLYWQHHDGGWRQHTLQGLRAVVPTEPMVHLNLFEADAYARWAGARLPRESELEHAARSVPLEGTFVEGGCWHPSPADPERSGLQQLWGEVWQWTSSSYAPYPGYQPAAGALGEYNGKFMCNQYVLRGGSCATPRSHMRPSYRNFFPAHARWQFSGLRLARDL